MHRSTQIIITLYGKSEAVFYITYNEKPIVSNKIININYFDNVNKIPLCFVFDDVYYIIHSCGLLYNNNQ